MRSANSKANKEQATVLVTGASGFVGRALSSTLCARGYRVRAVVRTPDTSILPDDADSGDRQRLTGIVIDDIAHTADWVPVLEGVHTVVHLAARTHVLNESGAESLSEYRRVNVEGTRQLAQEAARAGVTRFVFLSSIKVNGESTRERPFTEADPPCPEDAYGISKWEAEQALRTIAAGSGMKAVVLRPPLVYGPGVKGNLLNLLRAVARRRPLPLASIRNRRSLVYVGNLVDAIIVGMESPAAGGTYLVSDGQDLSTPELVRMLAEALGVPAVLLPCPPLLLALGGTLLGRSAAVSRLTGSLQIDSSRIRRELAWQPPYPVAEGMAVMARWYHAQSGLRPSY